MLAAATSLRGQPILARRPGVQPVHAAPKQRYFSVTVFAAAPRGKGAASGAGAQVASNSGKHGVAVMVVESPTKAQKIQKFLGDGYTVLASYGHIRDLPSRSGSVIPEEDFKLVWELSPESKPRVKAIADAVKDAHTVLLASDPDREGEAIAWHVSQELGAGGLLRGRTVQRVTFSEITKAAVTRAIESPRQVSDPLVQAYMARRALDYLVGFNISPLLWRKLPGARSAGRVQSVALRLVAERENEIEAFKPQEYWSITADLQLDDGTVVRAALTQANGKRVGGQAIRDRAQAEALVAAIKAARFKVGSVQAKSQQRSPAPPFITSTLQQEASRRLGFTAIRTMRAAQALYEGAGTGEGLITYMRTDGVQLSAEAVAGIRDAITATFGKPYVPPEPRVYKSRAKNAQEAHEAIRPTKPTMRPEDLPASVEGDARALYGLIWRRALACQMQNATIQQVGVDFASADGQLVLRATGSAVEFPGYLQAYDNWRKTAAEKEEEGGEGDAHGGEDGGAEPRGAANGEDAAARLTKLKAGQPVTPSAITPAQHFTRPLPRFTEATLVRALEERGVGRPSTYAPIMQLLQGRGYVAREGRALVPSTIGRVLSAFLTHYFSRYVDPGFTSELESQLDEVAGGGRHWREVLQDFWGPFKANCKSLDAVQMREVYDMLDAELGSHFFPAPIPDPAAATSSVTAGRGRAGSPAPPDPRKCPQCSTGRLVLKPSKYGGFIGCSNYDATDAAMKCTYTRTLSLTTAEAGGEDEEGGGSARTSAASTMTRVLGQHPDTGAGISVRFGPYGPYVQMEVVAGAAEEAPAAAAKTRGRPAKAKPPSPKRVPIPKTTDPASLTLEEALSMLAGPKPLGTHPDTREPILLQRGPFGPYVVCGEVSCPLPKGVLPEDLTLDKAVELISMKKARMEARVAKGLPPTRSWGKKGASPAKGKAKKGASSGNEGESGEKATKRGPNAYIVFCNEQRAALKASNPGAAAPQIMSLLAAQWRELPDADKARYHAQAAEAASAPAAPSSSSSSVKKASRSRSAPAGPDGEASEGEASSSGRAPSPYIQFCKAKRPEVKGSNPDASPSRIVSLLAEAWRGLSDAEKQGWASGGAGSAPASSSPTAAAASGTKKRSASDSEGSPEVEEGDPFVRSYSPSPSPGRAAAAIAGIQQSMTVRGGARTTRTPTPETPSSARVPGAASRGRSAAGATSAAAPANSKGRGGSSEREVSDTPAPKKVNPYLAYCGLRRPALKAQYPDASMGELSKHLAAEWRELSDAEKAEYAQS